ncbi:MAG: aldehyde dehydrogenase family protein [Chitinophagaceae bacterium]|nr:aldehyde dehydrogenase family protein [Chitinophagaceae bacterium]MDP1763355.1 aldehyde dehydrogenase family protein [Sediminibacterium sp.]MDP1812123.1 aldehyde dehydrogenase family protein [Sediminibacterium sp.]MDP3127041.1 aldehyde dehydrogenase family protein [Sediminibacterium sp.]MDP3666630.1 aldehyde dehydrogenase family protein [Sediminibacterium sp.]
MNIINPATHELITTVITDDKESIDKKISGLRAGQKIWAAVSLAERVSILRRFAALLQTHIQSCAETLTAEVGKPLQQSKNEVTGACTRINWLTANAAQYLSDEWMVSSGATREKIVYEPLGIICNISAWNYPYLVGTNVFVPALLAGNAVLYKPSELATLTGKQIEKYLHEAGVPENVFQLAVGAGDVGELLLEADMDGYFFTGSYQTGKYIYERVSKKMKPCGLELGGKDPLYVTDAITDIPTVAANTADGAFYNNGQSCCSVERIYVHEKVYDAYTSAFVAEVSSYTIGSPTAENIYIGALTRKEQPAFLAAQVQDALAKGATVLCGGKIIEGAGNYFEPTVLVDVTHEMDLMKEESFGPIIGIMKVNNDAEAIALMNDTSYGLTAAVFCTDENRAMQIQVQLNAGTVYWNCCDRVSAALPWSGRKHSGFGSTLSHAGLRVFTRPKGYHLRS